MVFDRLSIQSKLVLMLLSVSIGSILVISVVGYLDGERGLTHAIEDQLVGMRETRASQLGSMLGVLRNQALTLAAEEGTLHAVDDFKAAYRALDKAEPPRDADKALRAFYETKFLPRLAANLDTTPIIESYLPASRAARTLQYLYLARNPNPDYLDFDRYDGGDDGTGYTKLHRKYHPHLRDVVRKFQFEDLLLVDPETGVVVYSMQKATDFATSLEDGPYRETTPAALVASVRKTMDRGEYKLVDFDFYRPNLGLPSAFLATPIFDGPRMAGILVLQFPSEEVNRVMTGDRGWEKQGLGETGETYLVGLDTMLRSRSRLYDRSRKQAEKAAGGQADPKAAEAAAKGSADKVVEIMAKSGVGARSIKRARAMRTSVLIQPVRSESVKQALGGHSGIALVRNYAGVPVLSAYAPVQVEGLRWAILAEMEVDEAYGSVRAFGRKVLAYSAAIIVAVTILATVLTPALVRPLRRLAEASRRVGSGDVDVAVDVRGHDEFRELADAFNEMTRSLKAKSDLIDQKVRENEELLLNILPGPVAARRKGGDDQVSEGFADVSVLFADVVGFTELSESVKPDEAVGLLNELIGSIDEAADRFGVEKVKTYGSTYMAVCGLSVQRPDHTSRVVDLAAEVLRIVRRFNQGHGTSLAAEIGVNAGPVVGGIVGRSKFLYDLWGDTVNVARSIKSDATPNGILVTSGVKDRLKDSHEFEGPVEVNVRGKAIAAWAVKG